MSEETTYEKLPYFSEIKNEVLLEPVKGEGNGKPVKLVIDNINTRKMLSNFKDDKGNDKYEYWINVSHNNTKYAWKVSEAILKAILKTGILKQELPIEIEMSQFKKVNNGRIIKGYNASCPNHRGDWKASIDELISTFEGKNNQQQVQPQQFTQPTLSMPNNYNDEKRQEAIEQGMAFNAGIQLYINKNKKDNRSIHEFAIEAYHELKKFKEELSKREEVIRNIEFPSGKDGDFPVDEADEDTSNIPF